VFQLRTEDFFEVWLWQCFEVWYLLLLRKIYTQTHPLDATEKCANSTITF
jgi:hypothetical protein